MDKRRAAGLFDRFTYFAYDGERQLSTCRIDNCGKTLKGSVTGNMQRHIKSSHTNLAKSIGLLDDVDNERENNSSAKKPKMAYNQNTIKRACVGLTTIRGLPFSFFDMPETKFLLDPLFTKHHMLVTTKNNVSNIEFAAKKIKENIRQEVKGRMISIKVDSASRASRSVLGINCQFIENDVVIIRTLEMLEIFERQTSNHLRDKIMEVLSDYQITPNQIYTITTDNGANMVKAATLLSESEPETLENVDDGDSVNLMSRVEEAVAGVCTPVRCAAHTFQLAIRDVLVITDFAPMIVKIRKTVKVLKSIKFKPFFTRTKLTKPVLDCETRWGSTYLMIEYFDSKKEELAELHDEMQFGLLEWKFIEFFIASFKPLFILTKRLQSESLTMGDLFKSYLESILRIKALSNENLFKIPLLEAMEKRKTKLFDNDAFLCGIYFDPRFSYKGTTFFPPDCVEKIQVITNIKYHFYTHKGKWFK